MYLGCQVRLCVLSIFNNSRKRPNKKPWGCTIIIIIAHNRHIWMRPGPWPDSEVLQNSRSLMYMLRVKTLTVLDHHWQNKGKKILWRAQQYKSTCVCPLTGPEAQLRHSGPYKMTKGKQRFSAPYWNRTYVAWLTVAPLWYDLGRCSQTDVVVKLKQTSISHKQNVFFFPLNCYRAGHWPQKSENWELENKDRPAKLALEGWSVTQ